MRNCDVFYLIRTRHDYRTDSNDLIGTRLGDLLENYCRDDHLMNVARLLFCLTILLTGPIECFVARDIIINSLLTRTKYHEHQPTTEMTPQRFVVTALLVSITCIVSFSTDCLGIVLEFNVMIYFRQHTPLRLWGLVLDRASFSRLCFTEMKPRWKQLNLALILIRCSFGNRGCLRQFRWLTFFRQHATSAWKRDRGSQRRNYPLCWWVPSVCVLSSLV